MNEVIVESWSKEVKQSIRESQYAVLSALRELGGKGTMHQVAGVLKVPLNCISGRFSELSRKHLIEKTCRIRDPNWKAGRTVYRLISNVDVLKDSKKFEESEEIKN